MTDKDLGTAAGDIFAKAFTIGYETARTLLTDNEQRLTAEQVEDVRTAREALRGYRNFEGSISRGHVRGLIAAVDALFPATEPAAEPREIGWFRTMTPEFATKHCGFPGVIGSKGFWTHTASDGGKWAWDGDDWELRESPPAPAEPAEEETKAGTADAMQRRFISEIRSMNPDIVMSKRLDDLEAELNASSPVVPAPTETGPWKHRVNGEICVASPASGLPYTIGKFNDHGDFVWHSSSAELPAGFAPFVAAEEGRA